MNKVRTFLTATACLLAAAVFAEDTDTQPKDTTRVIDIEEVMVIASPKETGKLRELPAAVSLISQKDMQARQVTSLKDISVLVPNFFMPEYGSRLTSAIYIRGIGSRINTPVVGLYVDNIPYIDKSAFDFNFYDIERIDILRGPQATLYGRNTMGGLIKVHTRSPFSYQGTDIKLGYGSKDNHRTASATHYHRWSEHFAFSAGGYYEGSDGFFRNAANGQKIDGMEAGGGRIRAIWLPSENLRLDFTTGYDYSDEGGYPYYYEGPAEGHEKENEAYKDYIGQIAYNRDCSYRRGLFNAGLNIEYQADAFVLSAVTGFQNLNDRMFLDQDFLPVDIYTLEQKQRLNTLSEEITLKSKPGKAWQWTTGAFGFYQTLRTESPVTFRKDGMTFLNETINGAFPDLSGMGMSMNLALTDEALRVNGCFRTPVLSGALYHQSTYRIGSWEFTAGLRLEHEHTQMDYTGSCDATRFGFRLNSGRMPIALTDQKASSLLEGKLKNDYTQLLPKFAVTYRLDSRNNLYASVSKGYRSGGYNLQMFSDLAQMGLQNSIKSEINQGVGNRLDEFAQMGMPSTVISMIKGMMDTYLAPQDIDVREATVYKPEYSWNYELGSHLTLCKG
ncbi:MAG: TonB-dependent receptor, partial [Bacteroidales bacterium]|nr:TonB-dependent receptor [Bacteroidales bacterium]